MKGRPGWGAWPLAAAAALFAVGVVGCGRTSQPPAGGPLRIALVAKSLGNSFFNAVHKGGLEAAAGLGGVEVIFTGPTTPTAEGQIEVLNTLIAQHVEVIAVSANDPDALVPTLQRAMQRGIKVISYDSAVAPQGRMVHLAPSSATLIGETLLQLAARTAPSATGKVAIVSATPTSTNQNAWIASMRRSLPKFPGLQIVAVVYGDDVADKSYRETTALLQRYPDLAGIIAPTSVGVVAAAKAVEDQGASQRVFVTGLGLPSELAGHVRSGTVRSFAMWNPIDLGYVTVQVAVRIARGASAGPGRTLEVGRMGQIVFGDDGVAPMGMPFVYDASNIEQYAKVF